MFAAGEGIGARTHGDYVARRRIIGYAQMTRNAYSLRESARNLPRAVSVRRIRWENRDFRALESSGKINQMVAWRRREENINGRNDEGRHRNDVSLKKKNGICLKRANGIDGVRMLGFHQENEENVKMAHQSTSRKSKLPHWHAWKEESIKAIDGAQSKSRKSALCR